MKPFTTFWLCDGVRVESRRTVEKFVARGKTAVEVTAEQQERAHDERKRKARKDAALDERIRQAAAQRQHEQSPEGQAEAARRTAISSPGGIVSGTPSSFKELDAYVPAMTSPFR